MAQCFGPLLGNRVCSVTLRSLVMSGLCISLAVKLVTNACHRVVQLTMNSSIQAEETWLITKADNVRFGVLTAVTVTNMAPYSRKDLPDCTKSHPRRQLS
jgi:hypothetical protein